jgi:hypothetical protein
MRRLTVVKRTQSFLVPLLAALAGAAVFSCSNSTEPVGPALDTPFESMPGYYVAATNLVNDFELSHLPAPGLALVFSGHTYPSGIPKWIIINPLFETNVSPVNGCLASWWQAIQGAGQYNYYSVDAVFAAGSVNLYQYGNAFRFRAKAIVTNGMTCPPLQFKFNGTGSTGSASCQVYVSGDWRWYTVPFDEFRLAIEQNFVTLGKPTSCLSNCTSMNVVINTESYIDQKGMFFLDDLYIVDLQEKR